jgi:hypothetical protein
MSAPIDGIAGRVHADGSLPPAPHNSSLEYTAKLTPTSGVYTVTFKTPFSSAPSVVVTPYLDALPDSATGIDTPPATPMVYEITQSSFSVMFWTYNLNGQFLALDFVQRAFSFAAMEITSQKQG